MKIKGMRQQFADTMLDVGKTEIKLTVIKPFGPSVFKVEMPEKLVELLNSYVDKTIEDKKKSSELDHGQKLTGDVTQEFRLDVDFIKKSGWGEFLMKCSSTWLQTELKKKNNKI